ncbi:MAG: hypothetical protein CVT94_15165 [Bacteroidetes bacterium HGW-Bacteroidetes-11]|jgi:AcrR family transcriptional regulator|nr:MAG: hypothetical protein CVT94_15165 [Bacteroidetes bacterium HGW-Bacteroidetes-11]
MNSAKGWQSVGCWRTLQEDGAQPCQWLAGLSGIGTFTIKNVKKTFKPKKFYSFTPPNLKPFMDTRERIIEKASALFLSMGIRNVTMDFIAGELGISKRTIYELFKDKDDLVIQVLREMIVRNNEEMIGIISKTEHVIEAIFLILKMETERRKSFARVFTEDVKKYFPLINATMYADKKNLKEFSASYTLLEKGIRENIFRKDIRIDLVDTFLHELIGLMHSSERLKALEPTEPDALNCIFLPYFRGICTRKGVDLMDKYFSTNETT